MSDEFDGYAKANRIEIWRMPLRSVCNVVWYFLTKDADRKGIERLKMDLVRPLPGMSEEVSEEVVSAELAMFKQALAKKV